MKKVIFILLAIAFFSCKKEPIQGPQGEPGNANVKTVNATTTSGNWQIACAGSCQLFTYQYAPITQYDVTNASINMYIQTKGPTGTDVYTPLPASIQGVNYTYSYAADVFYIQATDQQSSTTANPGIKNFKLTVVPKP